MGARGVVLLEHLKQPDLNSFLICARRRSCKLQPDASTRDERGNLEILFDVQYFYSEDRKKQLRSLYRHEKSEHANTVVM